MDKKVRNFICSLIVLLLSLPTVGGTASAQKSTVFQSDISDWIHAEWSLDSEPYRVIRDNINRRYEQGEDESILLRRAETLYEQNPKDRRAIFRRYYTQYKVGKFDGYDFNARDIVYKSIDTLPKEGKNIYEFSRLRFLMQIMTFPDSRLIDLAKRLVVKNPSDDPVKLRATSLMSWSVEESERKLTDKWMSDLLKNKPNSSTLHGAYGALWYHRWIRSKSRGDAEKAIQGYTKYLSLVPADEPFRKEVARILSELKK